eukprot:CAMPEP_0174286824 /NCGR_PEP_ID=MMETSP0809-20121228/13231_1 /TAXON_ID=73025 ORGANISM="Eutreptiella gymnastica-like, Strain CCMP1594" /NCGR_SAMPLE_ID=MMETSP0809 /ASSEMBLY_ACC=CAM_ASM_000658 /LENGTH=45 /DNA_ID= /DNA_START= /DNA_END= /DNA_ORIENTATION=
MTTVGRMHCLGGVTPQMAPAADATRACCNFGTAYFCLAPRSAYVT